MKDLRDWAFLRKTVEATLPELMFFRVRLDTLDGALFPDDLEVERFFLWFEDGRATLGHFEGRVIRVLRDISEGRLTGKNDSWHQSPNQRARALMRLFRYKRDFELKSSEEDPLRDELEGDYGEREVSMIVDDETTEAAILHSVVNGTHLEGLREDWERLMKYADPNLRSFATRIGLSKGGGPVAFSVVDYQDGRKVAIADSLKSNLLNEFTPEWKGQLTPWLKFKTGDISTTGTTECCERFHPGPTVLVWRGVEPCFKFLGISTPNQTGIIARLLGDPSLEFAIPAYQSVTAGVVIRVDPAFARAAVGDGVDLEITLTDTHGAEHETYAKRIPDSGPTPIVAVSATEKSVPVISNLGPSPYKGIL